MGGVVITKPVGEVAKSVVVVHVRSPCFDIAASAVAPESKVGLNRCVSLP